MYIYCWQASLWIIIFSYVGNYFWTHYFFTVLGASYTFPSWKMNNVSLRWFATPFHSSGPISYHLVRPHTLLWFVIFVGGRYHTQHSCSLTFAFSFIMLHQTWHYAGYDIFWLIPQKKYGGLLKLHGFSLLLIL